MKPLVDWFSCSFRAVKKLDEVFSYFQLQKDDFKVTSGRWCYKYGYWHDCISVYYNPLGTDILFPDGYDVCVNMSGQGCRRFETIRGEDFDWVRFFRSLSEDFRPGTYNVSRVDVAFDVLDSDAVPDMMKIIKLVDERRYVSQFRRVVTGRGAEEWVMMGSPKSDCRLRIYNKALERHRDDGIKWVRFEYQLRDDAAHRFLNHLLHCGTLGQAFTDFIAQSVTFTKRANVSNSVEHHSDRLQALPWWRKFVEGAGEITAFARPGVEYNMTGIERYLASQVAPTLATHIACHGGDIGPLMQLIEDEKPRVNDKQKRLIHEMAG